MLANSYYGLLGVHPSASMRDIRQAYRDLSKLYHPDTTNLPTAIATAKFQQLNEAYATLSNPERRGVYDRKIGYSSVAVVQPLPNLNATAKQTRYHSSSAYLDPTDRPLSPGELFALFILGITFVGCLCLAIMVGLTRGEALLQPKMVQNDTVPAVVQPDPVVTARPHDPWLMREVPPGPLNAFPGQENAVSKPAGKDEKTPASRVSTSIQSKDFEGYSASSKKTRLEQPSLPLPQPSIETTAVPSSSADSLPDTPQKIQS